ncbi:MAG: glycoside hydrolase family 97 C-terminal domain-containing protein, partial [Duncaniella sp.]|nr:glycoside hydrolase family 97 C-terminal domain-containing protein [Duncaniella sp.]
SRLLDGYPSEYAVVARRSGDKWYIGAINGKDCPRTVTVKLPEECKGKSFIVITDGNDINTFGYTKIDRNDGTLTVDMLGNGGFATIIP